MDNYKIWIYVIIGVIYLLSRLRKKEPEPPQREDAQPSRDFEPTHSYQPKSIQPKAKPLTFEELLKEITQEKQPVPQPVSRQPESVDYDDNLGEEEQDLEDLDTDYRKKSNVFQTYEQAKSDAFNRPSLEETMKIEDTVVKFSKFKVFEEEKRRDLLEEYTRDLQDPEGFKKAVVLSEILNRRF
jgi:hypothetical protein